jgi:hypothetical protein
MTVLERLVPAAQLRYHGDFDWAGIAITNRLAGRVAVNPWLMTASDYETGLQAGRPALLDTPGRTIVGCRTRRGYAAAWGCCSRRVRTCCAPGPTGQPY